MDFECLWGEMGAEDFELRLEEPDEEFETPEAAPHFDYDASVFHTDEVSLLTFQISYPLMCFVVKLIAYVKNVLIFISIYFNANFKNNYFRCSIHTKNCSNGPLIQQKSLVMC